jgi:hypothetical protein
MANAEHSKPKRVGSVKQRAESLADRIARFQASGLRPAGEAKSLLDEATALVAGVAMGTGSALAKELVEWKQLASKLVVDKTPPKSERKRGQPRAAKGAAPARADQKAAQSTDPDDRLAAAFVVSAGLVRHPTFGPHAHCPIAALLLAQDQRTRDWLAHLWCEPKIRLAAAVQVAERRMKELDILPFLWQSLEELLRVHIRVLAEPSVEIRDKMLVVAGSYKLKLTAREVEALGAVLRDRQRHVTAEQLKKLRIHDAKGLAHRLRNRARPKGILLDLRCEYRGWTLHGITVGTRGG